ncbi:MAG: tRNA lysidine(34) synthetase TilS [Mailhella sp.]|nr:tRNA lysidine(34) synthetase TilS [Mailhella sp.]
MDLKSLSGKNARLCLSAASFAEECGFPLRGRSLLLALSGGGDSTALLAMAAALRAYADLHLYAAHFNHGIRDESVREATFVAEQCSCLEIPLISETGDTPAFASSLGIGLEEAGRRLRYGFLEQARIRSGCDVILTAHHLGDLAEDILMRLIRGASWPALGGMKAYVPDRHLLRPLLLVEKERLLRLADDCGKAGLLPEFAPGCYWAEDASNRSARYLRNRVRADLLPLFTRENPDFADNCRQMWRSARRDESLLEQSMADIPMEITADNSCSIPLKILKKQPASVRFRMYLRAISVLKCGQGKWENLEKLDNAIISGRTGKTVQFPGGITAAVQKQAVIFRG